jgi:cysteine desulfurase
MIYLDNAATTKPSFSAIKKAEIFNNEFFYNPSAIYGEGLNIHKHLEHARKSLIQHLTKSDSYNLTFTSGGSESDNLAILGVKRGNVVTTLAEHSAVYNCFKELKNRSIDVRLAKINNDGTVNLANLLNLIDSNTTLVSVIHVNNETGGINDINFIAKEIKKINPKTIFHSDGVQAFGKIPYKINNDIDLYSASAHKIEGLKGNGFLLHKKGINIKPLILGGGQEDGLRSGTENIFGIKVFEYAAEDKYNNIDSNYELIKKCNMMIRNNLDKSIFKILSSENSSPYILSVTAENVKGEVLIRMLENDGLICGTGSACSSKHRFSRVLKECGYNSNLLDGVLRISFNSDNTIEEIKQAIPILNKNADILHKKIN